MGRGLGRGQRFCLRPRHCPSRVRPITPRFFPLPAFPIMSRPASACRLLGAKPRAGLFFFPLHAALAAVLLVCRRSDSATSSAKRGFRNLVPCRPASTIAASNPLLMLITPRGSRVPIWLYSFPLCESRRTQGVPFSRFSSRPSPCTHGGGRRRRSSEYESPLRGCAFLLRSVDIRGTGSLNATPRRRGRLCFVFSPFPSPPYRPSGLVMVKALASACGAGYPVAAARAVVMCPV